MNAELRVVHYLNQFFGGIGGRLPGAGALPHAQGVARGFLRLAGAPAGAARAGGRTAGSRDRRDPRGDAATLREPPDSRGAGGARVPDRSQARGAAHAGSRAGRTAPPPVSGHDAGANRKRWQLKPRCLRNRGKSRRAQPVVQPRQTHRARHRALLPKETPHNPWCGSSTRFSTTLVLSAMTAPSAGRCN